MDRGEGRSRPRRRLSRELRLARARDFRRVFERPTRVSGGPLTVLARGNGRIHPRLGLAVSRRHVKTAVARNRIKRIIRESFRQHQGLLAGLDLVVMTRIGAEAATAPEIRGHLLGQWRRLGGLAASDHEPTGEG